ncbi:hypothetical protein SAMN05192563_1003215 [Paraburkholderia aspalathi]|uniref:Uncharacterized protein n=1 Tax=Paraburkholderia aspalathi TaxID=1324617 RepID=A0A1I7AA80_9BURK|nr:hypothetical protein SAMN05192563_1003215 [Paraburkholderia aspalathi]
MELRWTVVDPQLPSAVIWLGPQLAKYIGHSAPRSRRQVIDHNSHLAWLTRTTETRRKADIAGVSMSDALELSF